MGLIETVWEDIVDMAKFSTEFVKEKSTLKTFIILFALYLGMIIVPMVLLVGSLAIALSVPGLGLVSLAAVFASMLAVMLAYAYFLSGVYLVALGRRGIKTIPWNISAFARLIIGGICVGITVIFGLMDRKLFAASVILLGGSLLAAVAMYFSMGGSGAAGGRLLQFFAGLAFIFLLAAVYAIVATYSAVRLLLWPTRFFAMGEPIIDGIRKTWKMTEGKAARVFLAYAGITLSIAFVSFVLMFPIAFLRIFETMAMMLVFNFPLPVFSLLLQIAVSTLMAFPTIYALAALYSRITSDDGKLKK